VGGDDFVQALQDRLETLSKIAFTGFDATAGDVVELSAGTFNDAETRDLESRIDPEDSQSTTAVV
jgi:hypothetical protein